MSRYIDAEIAQKFFRGLAASKEIKPYTKIDWDAAYRVAADSIDEIPTADVVPVRHAHWKYLREEKCAFCTACKSKMNPNLYGYGFCPLCGARMDAKENEK